MAVGSWTQSSPWHMNVRRNTDRKRAKALIARSCQWLAVSCQCEPDIHNVRKAVRIEPAGRKCTKPLTDMKRMIYERAFEDRDRNSEGGLPVHRRQAWLNELD